MRCCCRAQGTVLAVVGLACVAGGLLAAGPPEPPRLSTVVPADDLTAQAKIYVASFAAILADEKQYEEGKGKLKRDANALAVLALVLAKHDGDSPLKKSAGALLAAARELAAAKDFGEAQKALAAVQTAAEGKTTDAGGEVKWEKVASMGQLMKQVTAADGRLKRGFRRFGDKTAEKARDAALLAAISQAIVYDTHEVKKSEDTERWYQFCGEMRDAAGQLHAKIKAGDKPGAEAAYNKVSQSCEDCHAVFRPDQ